MALRGWHEYAKDRSVAKVIFGGYIWKHSTEGSLTAAAKANTEYPRKCINCNRWCSSKEKYDEHMELDHSDKLDSENTSDSENELLLGDLGSAREYWFNVDPVTRKLEWRLKRDDKEPIGNVLLSQIEMISQVPPQNKSDLNPKVTYFVIQAGTRFLILYTNTLSEANLWCGGLTNLVFELSHPPPNYGGPSLINSIQSQNYDQIYILLNDGVDPNYCNDTKKSAFMYAVSTQNMDIINLLLEWGVNINYQDSLGYFPLYIACTVGDINIINLLLQISNIKATLLTTYYRNCLHAVCGEGFNINTEEIIENLVRYGVSPYTTDKSGKLPFHLLCSLPKERIYNEELEAVFEICVKYFLEIYPDMINAIDQEGDTPLHCAVRADNPMIIKCLLPLGANYRARNKSSTTPLYLALSLGFNECHKVISEYLSIPELPQLESLTPSLPKKHDFVPYSPDVYSYRIDVGDDEINQDDKKT